MSVQGSVTSTATESAVIVPVPQAEAAVSDHRRRLDVAASWGVPAHVTVVYPFVPPADIDARVVARLAAVLAAASPFDCTFDRCRWFGEDVLWLAPRVDREFRVLTDAVVAEFPDHPPYGGVHDDVVPHLTVGEASGASLDQLEAAEVEVARALPITAHLDRALLIAGTARRDSWRTLVQLPFGRPAVAPGEPGP
ncbi:2'-5' RNA ligase family protein [Mumia sp. DW29H23]|uniref:2'-5' RNA ligase family protein n=1 Tax=Mumia sp. DW29H23 TaxID=3421241 RepID=UPI003D69211F